MKEFKKKFIKRRNVNRNRSLKDKQDSNKGDAIPEPLSKKYKLPKKERTKNEHNYY